MSWIARSGVVAAIVGIAGLGLSAPALADTGNFGQQVVMCAHMMLPNDLNPDGSITMTMQGTTMTFPSFGAMVTFMRTHSMCS
jgi:hypothetical protein